MGNKGNAANKTLNEKIRDSVFTDMFGKPKYQLQMVRALHPEMSDLSEKDIRVVTLTHVLLNKQYNDLGLLLGDRLILLAEAQSSWSVNIAIRSFLYAAESIMNYIRENKLNVFSPKAIRIPKPELFVIYTGDKWEGREAPEYISLVQEFFDGQESAIEVRVKVLQDRQTGDIIDQYIRFCKVYESQIRKQGRTRFAVEETLRICMKEGILVEYLEGAEKEVMNMIDLFTQEVAMEFALHEQRELGREDGWKQGLEEGRQEARLEKTRGISTLIQTLRELGKSESEIMPIVEDKYQMTEKEIREILAM